MSKANYTVEDFVLDPEFRKWIFKNNPEAKAYWESYLQKHPEKVQEIELARKILIHLPHEKKKISEEAKDSLWESISQGIDQESREQTDTKVVNLDSWSAIKQYEQEQSKKSRIAWKRKVAAVLILVASVGYFLTKSVRTAQEDTVEMVAEIEVHQAPPGVKSTITLEDGSKVFLNSGSKISYTKGFTDSLRLLQLEGEGYFEVAHDKSRPFVVQTGSISTTALGTSFNISSFPGDSVSISLVTGVVLVKNGDVEETLMPGEGIIASTQDSGWKKERFDVEQVLSWMNKTLIFKNTPFDRASLKLENWFGVDIVFENLVPNDLMVSGKFKDESLENILKGLSYSSRFEYELKGKQVYIHFKP
ncbi:FecR family protein [Algoriphagus zhangzhouensis]|uniref:FecR family protein n=1 Tax=Algoriphagus zhangzhouensis TaxID=1073327 RepID=A0A1M7ZG77_9BACT|nr:FecR family protein [Algoriphagus zhangzhouensis]TDY44825.1 FecR family protein [Algoriphagus zhangzhouensis]SHO63883.1 FecR family protein [Algoriphagus zhangzhouensis]